MRIEEAQKIVEGILPKKRFDHTLGVVETAKKLAERYHENIEKAALAAMLHDIAKFFSKEDMIEVIKRREDIPDDLLEYHLSLWHAPVGAAHVEEKWGVTDPGILNSIIYHTTGRKNMARLEKIIFLADYIEPGRDFPGVAEAREMASQDLDLGVANALGNTIVFLVSRHQQVYPDTIKAYNDLIENARRNFK